MLRRSRWLVLLALGLALARPAAASPPVAVEADPAAPQIFAGEPVTKCAWPTAVAVTSGGLCSGTLIHPSIVVYAAHCGGGIKTVRFGEDAWTGGRPVAVERCATYPSYAGAPDQGHDWAYCVLSEPVADVPIAPALYGCEREQLEVGKEVAIVGYGQTAELPSGTKHWAATTLAAVTPANNTALVGNPNMGSPSICAGDSGGPGLIQLADGSWRTFGITSTVAGECGGYGALSTLSGAVPWIEQDSGVDVTPCHTIDGSWAPGPACVGAFAADPNVGVGTWIDWCSGTPSVGASTSCGPAWDAFDPSALPSVAISSPAPMQTFLQGIEVHVEVAAAKHPDGFAISRVSLLIDDQTVDVDVNDPWEFFGPPFPGPGIYTLKAVAEDWAGNRVESEPVVIGWGETEFPEPGGDTGTDTDTGEALVASGESSCTVTRSPSPTWLLGLLGLAWLRRRR